MTAAAEISVSAEHADAEPGRSLLEAMQAELDALYRDRPGSLDSLPVSADELQPPGGSFLVLRAGRRPVACGGVKALDAAEAVGEIKRMYVVPDERGRGVARRLLAELEAAAVALGYRRLRLDTGADQPAARRIYESSGYRAIEPYNDNPYAAYWFEKAVGS